MLQMLSYGFIQRALIAGLASACTAAVLGNFVVASRQSVVSDMLAHVALAGVGLGVLLGISPVAGAIAICLLGGILLWKLSGSRHYSSESFSIMLLTGGLALALLLAHLAKDNPISFDTYLFGSILTITRQELMGFLVLDLSIMISLITFWNRILVVALDPEFAQSRYPGARSYQLLFLLAISLFVAVSLKVIGGLLVSALLVVPVLAAQNLARSFSRSVLLSIAINLVAIAAGITISYYLDWPTSSAIVLSLLGLFLLSYTIKQNN